MKLSRPYAVAVALCALLLGAVTPPAALADEGFWTFGNAPLAKIKAAYGVDITPAWLAHVQANAVRLSVGCSASVVSAGGLILTNDHCATGCAQAVSPQGADYEKDGYLAKTREAELACPGTDAEILEGVTDVTPRMIAAGAGLAGEALVKARNAAASIMEQEVCGTDPKLHCELVNLYRGGEYKVYKYRKYSDVRLVFSPGGKAAFFGGDPDNFNFPRYDLDCAFLRLYQDGKPAATPGHLMWNPAPPRAGQPVFIAGNPGITYRQDTMAALESLRDFALPLTVSQLSELRGRLIRFIEESPDHARMATGELDGVENEYKVYRGLLQALDDPAFMAAKAAAEADLRAKATARMGPGFGDPWADIARAEDAGQATFIPFSLLEGGPNNSLLFGYARGLVRAAEERAKPSADRLPQYADSQIDSVKQGLLDPQPVEPALEQLEVEFWLSKSRELLTADDPDTALLLGRESPEALSAELVAGSHLADPAVRKALWEGGLPAIQASNDPMIQFALRIDAESRRARAAYEDQVAAPIARAAEAIARARFAILGDSVYPDATFTLRLSYGDVEGWTWRGKATQPFTTFAGLYTRATGAPPFDLDPRWVAAQGRLDPDTVFDFTTNTDIIGGNSGSPVLDAEAEVIGTAFDGNILSIGGDYGFDPRVNRTVALSAAAITEALSKVYGADGLVAELSAR